MEEMARNVRGDAPAGWLNGAVDVLGGANPFDEIAEGRYKQMIDFARGQRSWWRRSRFGCWTWWDVAA